MRFGEPYTPLHKATTTTCSRTPCGSKLILRIGYCGAEDVNESGSFEHKAAEIVKDGRRGVGTIVCLIADTRHRDQTRGAKRDKFALHCTGTGARQMNQFPRVIATIGISEKEPEHALSHVAEQRICNAR